MKSERLKSSSSPECLRHQWISLYSWDPESKKIAKKCEVCDLKLTKEEHLAEIKERNSILRNMQRKHIDLFF